MSVETEYYPLSSFFPNPEVTDANTARGIVCVVECELPLDVIKSYLESKMPGNVGPCTVIHSGQRATRNTVTVITTDLYSVIDNEIKSGSSPIIRITPYLVCTDNSPKLSGGQSENIFLRFTPGGPEMPVAEVLKSELNEVLEQLVSYGIIDNAIWNIDIPLSERNKLKVPMKYAFIKFTHGVSVEQSIYIRAVLNGYWLQKCDVVVGAYWSDRGTGRRRGPGNASGPFNITGGVPSNGTTYKTSLPLGLNMSLQQSSRYRHHSMNGIKHYHHHSMN